MEQMNGWQKLGTQTPTHRALFNSQNENFHVETDTDEGFFA